MCTQRWIWIRCRGRRLIGPGDTTEPCKNPAPQMAHTDPTYPDGPITPCSVWLVMNPAAVQGSETCLIFCKEWNERKGIFRCKICVERTKHEARVEQINHVVATYQGGASPDYRTADCVHGAEASCFRCTKTFPAEYLNHGEEEEPVNEEAEQEGEEEDETMNDDSGPDSV